jgi:AraC-like DNA-binding protein
MELAVNALNACGAAWALMLGLGHLVRPQARSGRSIVSAALFCTIGVFLALLSGMHLELLPADSPVQLLQIPLVLALGPLIRRYYRQIFTRPDRPSNLAVQLAPAVLALPVVFAMPRLIWLIELFGTLAVVTVAAYLIDTGRQLARGFDRFSFASPPARAALLVLTLCGAAALAFLLRPLLAVFHEHAGAHGAMWLGTSLISLAVLATYLAGMRYPELLHQLRTEAERVRYRHSRLGGLDADALIVRLRDFMKHERPFLDEDLRMADVAAELNINTHQLSEILNARLGLSFKNYVNRLRVDAASRLLREEPDRSMLSIALAVGFSSKSAFNRAFQTHAQKSPSAVRKHESRRIP